MIYLDYRFSNKKIILFNMLCVEQVAVLDYIIIVDAIRSPLFFIRLNELS